MIYLCDIDDILHPWLGPVHFVEILAYVDAYAEMCEREKYCSFDEETVEVVLQNRVITMLVLSHVAIPFHFPFSLNTPCATTTWVRFSKIWEQSHLYKQIKTALLSYNHTYKPSPLS